MDIREQIKLASGLLKSGAAAQALETILPVLGSEPQNTRASLVAAECQLVLGNKSGALIVLAAAGNAAPTTSTMSAIARLLTKSGGDPSIRAAVIGHGTLEPLADHLCVAAAAVGIHASIKAGEYDQWARELMDPSADIWQHQPQVVFLTLDTATLLAKLVDDAGLGVDAMLAYIDDAILILKQMLTAAAAAHPGVQLVVHGFGHCANVMPVVGGDSENHPANRLAIANQRLRNTLSKDVPGVVVLDQAGIEASVGTSNIRDERLYFLAGIRFTDALMRTMAEYQASILMALLGKTRKCLVLDCDHTLWGGVVGEDGTFGVHVGGSSNPGNAFAAFQKGIKRLQSRGVILAVLSKNNEQDALDVFQNHPGMLLRETDIAAHRINWNDKASNLTELARELNIGTDSMVFLDDNPMERALMRQVHPEVLTPELPADPSAYAAFLAGLRVFETLQLTGEDVNRTKSYAENQQRASLEKAAAGDYNAYLHSLGIRVQCIASQPGSLSRITQLINKTNQFNATTRRVTDAEVAEMHDSPEWIVIETHVADRFGDSGLTGIALCEVSGSTLRIDNVLLSCRVLGRGVETTLMACIIKAALAHGCTSITGLYIPSAKNAPIADYFDKVGFTASEQPDGSKHYTATTAALNTVTSPTWISLTSSWQA